MSLRPDMLPLSTGKGRCTCSFWPGLTAWSFNRRLCLIWIWAFIRSLSFTLLMISRSEDAGSSLFEDHAFFVSHLFKDSGINFKQSLMEIVYVSYFSVQIHPVSFIFPSKLLQICWCDLRNPLAQKFQSLIFGYRISALDMDQGCSVQAPALF